MIGASKFNWNRFEIKNGLGQLFLVWKNIDAAETQRSCVLVSKIQKGRPLGRPPY